MRFAIFALATSLACAQTPAQVSKVFQFTQNQSENDLQQMTVLVRGITDAQNISTDSTAQTLAINGSAGQTAMAGWLVRQMDLSAAPTGGVNAQWSPSPNDTVRVFYATQAATLPALQELATNIRSVADIRRLFVYNRLKAVAIRDTDAKVSLAAWLMDQLNQPPGSPAPSPHEYKLSDNDIARVFELKNPPNPQSLQEIATLVRSVADIQRMFIYNRRKSLSVRGTADRVALAEWLVSELDRPASALSVTAPMSQEYRLPEGASPRDGETVVRVFYLPPQPPADLHKTISAVRANAQVRRTYIYNTLYALAVRGTPGEILTAEKTIEEIGKTQPPPPAPKP